MSENRTAAGRRGSRRGSVRLCCLASLLGLLGLTAPLKLGVVTGTSMSPTYHSGDLYLLDRHHYLRNPVRRGEVLVFHHDGATYIKRVLAAGGDTVYLWKHRDDAEAELISEAMLPCLRKQLGRGTNLSNYELIERRIPAGYCFVVGDNVNDSVDSRELGPIPVEEIQGKVLFSPPPGAEGRLAVHPSVVEGS